MPALPRDLVYALRSLRRSPGVTCCATLMLSLAIGGATAVFSVVNAALLRPFPHFDLDRWANLYERPVNEGLSQLSVSIPNFRDWRLQSRSFQAMALWFPWTYNISGSDLEPERVQAVIITPDVFRVFGLAPAAGRLLQAGDESAPHDPERPIMISHGLWQRRFGGDPSIVGRKIQLNLVDHKVVGVAPEGFSFPPGSRVDVWAPQSEKAILTDTYRDARGNQVVGLLKPGAGFASAQAEMDVIASGLAARYREDAGFGVQVVPLREGLTSSFRAQLLSVLGALGLLILLVSVNVANLQLVRLEARRRDLAVRAALGASRAVLVRQAFFESALVALAAGLLGVVLAPAGVSLLLSFVPAGQVPWLVVPVDRVVLLVSFGITAVVTLISGLLPAWRAVRLEVSPVLSRGAWTGAAPVGRRLRYGFVVTQLALSFVLVVGAALLIRSFLALQAVDPGFSRSNRVVSLSYTAPRARYADAAALALLADRIREAVGQAPGVAAAGAAQALPFAEGAMWFQALTLADPRSVPNVAELPHVHYNVVTPGYAEALGVPLQSGRLFSSHDRSSSEPVVIVNAALARRFFPGADPIGRRLWVGHAQALPESPPRTVVGVVGDARWEALDTPAGPEAWVPLTQQATGDMVFRTLWVVIETTAPPDAGMASVRAAIRGVDRDLALTTMRTLSSRVDDAVWRQRLSAMALGALGLAALLVALLGVFAVTNHLVGRRTHELGVRIALGAQPLSIVRLVLAECGALVLAGVALGVGGALAAGRGIASLLYGVTASDAATLAVTAGGLALAALLAGLGPALRAARVDPLLTLRAE
jgi:putative ABC transport system permease protein